MRRTTSDFLPSEEMDWIDAYLDGTIDPESFDALQERMLQSQELRSVMRRYLGIDHCLHNEGAPGVGSMSTLSATGPWLESEQARSSRSPDDRRRPSIAPIAIAASIAFFLGLGVMHWGAEREPPPPVDPTSSDPADSFAEGFAVLARLFDPEWPAAELARREGDSLGAERFLLSSGTAELRFFSGATMTVEGPAEISVQSAWEATCLEGAVRVRVPPAARGFKLHAPSTEIVDLGTEFGLVVRDGIGQIEVFDGEIALRQHGEDEKVLTQGSALALGPDGTTTVALSGQENFPDLDHFGTRTAIEMRDDYRRWCAHRDSLAQDERLIAYFTFEHEGPDGLIPNLAPPRIPERDGAPVLAEPTDGRWPGSKPALEFKRPGSRVRVNLPGEFPAFTFSCWLRIDSLDRRYNALFMADSYETGEPHWQIRDDGKLMLSVMVDDSLPHPRHPQSRYHHNYYSPKMWDLSMSGQWLHLASVFDPGSQSVCHYVNGRQISQEAIAPEFMINSLRIGNGEIGNWGEPFRQDPSFAIRNLNGRVDEMAIFQSALSSEEIQKLYQASRAQRH